MSHPLPLNPAQREAVEHSGGPLLVLAGAGSGKTRVLTARIAHLITTLHVAPQRIFAVTFTNKAAGEMRTRVAQLLGADPRGLWIGTFHSLSARLLRREAPLLGFGPNFTIYDVDDQAALIRRILEQRGVSPKAYPPRALQGIISAAKNRMLLPEELGAQADTPLARVAADVFAALGPALKQANAMDFDDLLLHPLVLFREHPERLAYWQDRFVHVLVDEFQDTNAAQYLWSSISPSSTAICASWVTTTRRSTAGAARTSGTCSRSRTTFRARSWCGWSRTTGRRRSSSMRPTVSSPRTRRGWARRFSRTRRAAIP